MLHEARISHSLPICGARRRLCFDVAIEHEALVPMPARHLLPNAKGLATSSDQDGKWV